MLALTNAAFATPLTALNVSQETLLTKVLTYHVIPARVLKAEVPLNTAIRSVQGETFTVDTSLVITDQNGRKNNLVATDVFTSNGVIHAVDKVILPRL